MTKRHHIFISVFTIFFITMSITCHSESIDRQPAHAPVKIRKIEMASPKATRQKQNNEQYNDPMFPETVTLCGEKIPLENRRVWEMLDREFTIAVWNQRQVFLWLKRAARYFPYIEKKLAEAGMPDDLKYLAVAESDLQTAARSPVGALGYWQFMPFTGKRFGLKKRSDMDERLCFEKATGAALQYLKKLEGMFGKWTLALASYNCGERCLQNAMDEQHVKDYFRLNLPVETERFIFRITAIKLILENPQSYGYNINPKHVYQPLKIDILNVNLKRSVSMVDFASALDTDFKVIKELNPHIFGTRLPQGSYQLNVPQGDGVRVASSLKRLTPKAAPRTKKSKTTYYRVKSGDSLGGIATKKGVSVKQLKRLNKLKSSHIEVGQKLRLR